MRRFLLSCDRLLKQAVSFVHTSLRPYGVRIGVRLVAALVAASLSDLFVSSLLKDYPRI